MNKRAGRVETSHYNGCEWDLGAHSKSAITISRARVFTLELRWHRVTFTSLDLYLGTFFYLKGGHIYVNKNIGKT